MFYYEVQHCYNFVFIHSLGQKFVTAAQCLDGINKPVSMQVCMYVSEHHPSTDFFKFLMSFYLSNEQKSADENKSLSVLAHR
jgi:hypothetical protein